MTSRTRTPARVGADFTGFLASALGLWGTAGRAGAWSGITIAAAGFSLALPITL